MREAIVPKLAVRPRLYQLKISIGGSHVRFIDTAGLRETTDPISDRVANHEKNEVAP